MDRVPWLSLAALKQENKANDRIADCGAIWSSSFTEAEYAKTSNTSII